MGSIGKIEKRLRVVFVMMVCLILFYGMRESYSWDEVCGI